MTFKFFLNPHAIPDAHAHICICLAQGLLKGGHEILCNHNYWDSNLFVKNDDADWDIEIFDWRYAYSLPYWSFDYRHASSKKFKILIDRNTNEVNRPRWAFEAWTQKVHLILTVHGMIPNGKAFKNVKRWSLGISEEAMNMIDSSRATEKTSVENDSIWISWRSLLENRKLFELNTLKGFEHRVIKKLIEEEIQTEKNEIGRGRLQQEYFKFLNNVSYTACICGYHSEKPYCISQFYKNSLDPRGFLERAAMFTTRKVIEKLPGCGFTPKTRKLLQWDSFRLWESFYSDTVPVMFDFEHWDLDIEVRPIPWKHYIPIKNLEGPDDALRVTLSSEERANIAAAGTEFFNAHYSPTRQAERLIQCIEER